MRTNLTFLDIYLFAVCAKGSKNEESQFTDYHAYEVATRADEQKLKRWRTKIYFPA